MRVRCFSAVVLAALMASPTLADDDLVTAPRHATARVQPAVQWDHQWLDGAVFYEVFVRSFQDSDGDGIGDLRGLIDRLDYLNDGDPATDDDLGVTGLWLMPIFESPSYHGYDTVDYEEIDSDYGTLADFEELVREAEARGIRIVLDLVLNHSSSRHPWFEASASDRNGPYGDWYVWRDSNPGWTPPWGGSGQTWHANPLGPGFYYGVFWGGMPDLNFMHGEVRREAVRLAKLWLDRGAAGFRLDATRYLIETGPGNGQADTAATHGYWQEFSQAVRRHRPDAMLVAENWTTTQNIAPYFGDTDVIERGDELPLNFNFPLADAIIDAVRTGRRDPVDDVLLSMAAHYPEGARDAPFLTNHDHIRVASQLGEDPGRLRAAASVLLTLPGVPFLYYGEEIGLPNGVGTRDEAKRTPMPWDDGPGGGFTTGSPWFGFSTGLDEANVADQLHDPGSLLAHYRGLIDARTASPALGGGLAVALDAGTPAVLALLRDDGEEQVLVVVNLTGTYQVANGIPAPSVPEERLYADGLVGTPTGGAGNVGVVLPPHATGVWRLE